MGGKSFLLLGVTLAVIPTVVAAQSRAEDHTYDELGRLVSTKGSGTTAGEARSWCFDEAGNRLAYEASDTGATHNCLPPTSVPSEPADVSTQTPPPTEPANIPPDIERGIYLTGLCGETGPSYMSNFVVDPDDSQLLVTYLKVGSGPATISGGGLNSSINYGSTIGLTSYTITVSDDAGGSDTETFTIETQSPCPEGGFPGGSDEPPPP
ncbi:hypothetical protein T8S45_00075 [Blastomonas marina]|uniref:hypothetical protein n=1 Tax=Blastomonas marina TaxID=1867408 RepID=UPI002AC9A391|nr:hypothetical protein [Blastomonas marina]WPZ03967.1 hypothetical protein T8S45_00075 [Blastomonas marina]